MTRTYRVAMGIAGPIVRRWGRLEVTGAHLLDRPGPLLLVANHDSQWDPVVIGVSAVKHRQIRALAKSELWKNNALAKVLDGMGQIPIERGRGDAKAMEAAADVLRDGACIGVFPEGTVSRGLVTRAHSGAGRLAQAVPDVYVLCCRVVGSVDLVRFPKRPHVKIEYFEPSGGQPQPDESAIALMRRTVAEIRVGTPYAIPGRKKTAAKYRARAEEVAAKAAAEAAKSSSPAADTTTATATAEPSAKPVEAKPVEATPPEM
ncbi:1-acyl-sn-glycerol-3-phosphate acyltransferase [Frankineae bacterium MT45]|nr:1-acyl-sn-glycerol-3-phosphate acyltransferase [Frankineae bacterium MT45]